MQFQCNICLKTFTRQSDLNRHKDTVHGSNFISCDKCDKTFNRKDIFLRHQRSCSLVCKYCDADFEQKTDLDIHIKSIHDDHKYMCSKCEKKYVDKRSLKKHRQTCTNIVSDFLISGTILTSRNKSRNNQIYPLHTLLNIYPITLIFQRNHLIRK